MISRAHFMWAMPQGSPFKTGSTGDEIHSVLVVVP